MFSVVDSVVMKRQEESMFGTFWFTIKRRQKRELMLFENNYDAVQDLIPHCQSEFRPIILIDKQLDLQC